VKRAALALAAALLLQMGCRTLPSAVVQLPADDPRPQALLAGWTARGGGLRSLRGSARVSLDGARGASFARQLLAVERPARLRVEVLGLLNQRIAVLATDGERYDLYRAESAAVETGQIRPSVLWEVAGVPLTPEEAVGVLLGAPRMQCPGEAITGAVEGAEARVRFEIRCSDPYWWFVLEFDARELLSRYQVGGPEGTLYEVRYDDYRELGDTGFAHRVELDFPLSEIRAEVEFRSVEVNPTFPENLFRLELPERVFSPPGGSSE
jgi:hypothetical protein